MTAKALAAPLLLALALSACSSAPQYADPQMPEGWFSAAGAQAADAETLAAWWRQFDDPQLTALVSRAMQQNHDVRLAMARVDSARAQLRQSRAGLLPADAERGGLGLELERGGVGVGAEHAEHRHRGAVARPGLVRARRHDPGEGRAVAHHHVAAGGGGEVGGLVELALQPRRRIDEDRRGLQIRRSAREHPAEDVDLGVGQRGRFTGKSGGD